MFKTAHELASEEHKNRKAMRKAVQLEWDVYFIKMARLASTRSKDQSSKFGCVITGQGNEPLTMGYNGLPRGIEYDDEKQERPNKYIWFEHAERNAIFNAARVGTPLAGATAYISGTPCPSCARALIQAGIVRVVVPENQTGNTEEPDSSNWRDDLGATYKMLGKAGIAFEVIKDD
jgi:dCMP deaminase